jgi:hypothetical protein
MVDNVAADPCDPHFGALSHSIDELGEETSLGVFEIPEVHFDKQIHIPRVYDLG